jgi:hypothetical protein
MPSSMFRVCVTESRDVFTERREYLKTCTGYLALPFLKLRREQRFSIALLYNFLKVYASIFDFLQYYESSGLQ